MTVRYCGGSRPQSRGGGPTGDRGESRSRRRQTGAGAEPQMGASGAHPGRGSGRRGPWGGWGGGAPCENFFGYMGAKNFFFASKGGHGAMAPLGGKKRGGPSPHGPPPWIRVW